MGHNWAKPNWISRGQVHKSDSAVIIQTRCLHVLHQMRWTSRIKPRMQLTCLEAESVAPDSTSTTATPRSDWAARNHNRKNLHLKSVIELETQNIWRKSPRKCRAVGEDHLGMWGPLLEIQWAASEAAVV